MVKFIIVIIVSFCIFIASLIVLTRKEERQEKQLLNSRFCIKGYIDKVERTGKSISNGELILTYSVTYKYKISNEVYFSSILYEIKSDVLEVFPEIVDIYYDEKNPKKSIVKVNLEQSKIRQKETVKSVLPSFIIAFVCAVILIHFFVIPLF